MNKTELIANVAEKSALSKKDAEKAVNAVVSTIEESLKAGEKVQKVEIDISTTADKIGKWQGAFGSSTTVDPDY